MIAAHTPVQRPRDARLLIVDVHGRIAHVPRSRFLAVLKRGDLVIANDAVTLPASLRGRHAPSGAEVEVRLAGSSSLACAGIDAFSAVVFGAVELAPPPQPTDSNPKTNKNNGSLMNISVRSIGFSSYLPS